MPARAETIKTSGSTVDSGNAQAEYGPSLRKSLEGAGLNKDQSLAADTLDQFSNLSPSDRKTLFYFFLWHETGSFAAIKRFEETREDQRIGTIIDRVLDDDRLTEAYGVFYSRFKSSLPQSRKKLVELLKEGEPLEEAAAETELDIVDAHELRRETMQRDLLKKPNVVDVLELKKQGLTYKQIMKILGISESKVGTITSMLIAAGLIETHPKGKVQGEKFRARLGIILPLREKLNAPEIAVETGFPQEYIRGVFNRLRFAGQVDRLNQRIITERTPTYRSRRFLEIREGVKRLRNAQDHKYTDHEIVDILTKELGQEVTKYQVKRQIIVLLAKGEIKRRKN